MEGFCLFACFYIWPHWEEEQKDPVNPSSPSSRSWKAIKVQIGGREHEHLHSPGHSVVLPTTDPFSPGLRSHSVRSSIWDTFIATTLSLRVYPVLGEPCITGINLAYMGLPTCLPTKVRIQETSLSSPRQRMSVFQKISWNRLLCGIEATPRTTVRPEWVERQVLSIFKFF